MVFKIAALTLIKYVLFSCWHGKNDMIRFPDQNSGLLEMYNNMVAYNLYTYWIY